MTELLYCVVCGAGSHRDDWFIVSGDYVACDFHTPEQFNKAIAKDKETKAKRAAVEKAEADKKAADVAKAATPVGPPKTSAPLAPTAPVTSPFVKSAAAPSGTPSNEGQLAPPDPTKLV
jgi:hypothetical protein